MRSSSKTILAQVDSLTATTLADRQGLQVTCMLRKISGFDAGRLSQDVQLSSDSCVLPTDTLTYSEDGPGCLDAMRFRWKSCWEMAASETCVACLQEKAKKHQSEIRVECFAHKVHTSKNGRIC